ncbi:hypothetical protein CEN44_04520 [Fischerella muscicola CCMEE 5323]|uniref:Uncharacterized protein n=1 Tax=Fischerella muscicola CCMEE 5323 TaxID=2019572 RepID=A0A2N6K7I5_FISMU|nr:hypothetical protein CEN44_04520 [Fischerella muscicola CCMEE 5323]
MGAPQKAEGRRQRAEGRGQKVGSIYIMNIGTQLHMKILTPCAICHATCYSAGSRPAGVYKSAKPPNAVAPPHSCLIFKTDGHVINHTTRE